MIASLDLARFPLWVAEREALAARRAGKRSEAARGSWAGVTAAELLATTAPATS
jgi:hypothetical protein